MTEKKGRGSIMKIKICEPDRRLKLEFSKDCSVVESDFFAGAGANRLKSSGSGLLLCDLGVLWWQSCATILII